MAGGNWDVGADYRAKFGGVRIRVQAQHNNVSATSRPVAGSSSVSAGFLHDSGVNAAFATGWQHLDNSPARVGGDGKFWYFNVGYRAKIFAVGGTNISFNWNRTEELVATAGNNSEGDAVGFSIAQIFNPIGANMVLSYRNYSFDTDTATFEDVDVISLQTVFNF